MPNTYSLSTFLSSIPLIFVAACGGATAEANDHNDLSDGGSVAPPAADAAASDRSPYWSSKCVEYEVTVESTEISKRLGLAQLKTAVTSAIDLWESKVRSCGAPQLSEKCETSGAQKPFRMRFVDPSAGESSEQPTAESMKFSSTTKAIGSVEIRVFPSALDQPLTQLLLHSVGHGLGAAHVTEKGAIMSIFASAESATLTEADVDTVCKLYK